MIKNEIFTMNHSIKIALVGTGYWGKNLARNLSALGALHSVCDLNQQAASDIAAQFNVKALSYDQILQDKSVAALVIATQAASHFNLAKAAIENGKHVFVEKPLTLLLNDALKLRELALKANKIVMVGHLLQYHPIFIKLKEIVHSNELGEIKYIYSNRIDFGKFYPGENVILNLASHDVSMILSLAKLEPSSVQISSDQPSTDAAIINLTFPNHLQAHVFISRLNPFKEHKLVVVGSKTMAVFNDTEQDWNKKLCLYPYNVEFDNNYIEASKGSCQFIEVEKSEPLKNECLHFINCILNNQTPTTSADEAIRVMKVLCKK